MKITRALRTQINEAVRAYARGASPLAEVGMRGEHWTANALLWQEEDDLGDLDRLANLREIGDDPANPGCAILDLYVTTGTGNDRQLDRNVYVAIRDGQVVAAHDSGRRFDVLCDALTPAFPHGAGWIRPVEMAAESREAAAAQAEADDAEGGAR